MESSLPVELVPNLNRIAHGIELELELMQKNHENPSPDSNPSLELIQPYYSLRSYVAERCNMQTDVRSINVSYFKYEVKLNHDVITIARESIGPLPSSFFVVLSRVPRKRPKMVGIGKSGFDSSSYAEFSQEHDQHLTLDVWWPNHE